MAGPTIDRPESGCSALMAREEHGEGAGVELGE